MKLLRKLNKNKNVIESIEDVEMVWFNVKILKFWAVLIDDNWRQYFSYIPFFFLILLQLLDLHYTEKPIADKIHDTYMTMLMFNTFLRTIIMVTKRHKFTQILEYIKDVYTELMMRDDLEIRRILKEHTELVLKVSKINFIVGILTGVGFSGFPIMSDKREFIFGVYVPYLDEYQSPCYEILLTIQCALNLYALCMFIPFTGMFVSFIIFAIAISKILQYKLSTIFQEISSKIIKCINLHLKLIRFVNNINERNFTISLVDLILFVVVLCIMLLSLILVNTVLQKCIIIIYIITIFSQPFILYYFSNELYYESLEISTAAYNVNWYNFDIETQKMLKIFLLRSQKPCA
ncbi:odorant receptor 30a-like, partial [Musca vetustissima]|uniref:odorant receptor 30a-like n=1 Tax=Musca vetustissima TaxID=27455 RepID=UPI002AB75F09